MEQIVLLLNPCFPLVSLSGFPPPFHLPAVLVKLGPQRHLLSVVGSRDGPGSSPHLPCFAMGGRVIFWLLSGESVLKLTYQVARELLPGRLCDLSSGTARTGGRARHRPRPGLRSLPTTGAGFGQTYQPQFLRHPTAVTSPGGMDTVGTSWPTEHLGPAGCPSLGREPEGPRQNLRKTARSSLHGSESSARTNHASAHGSQLWPRLRAE